LSGEKLQAGTAGSEIETGTEKAILLSFIKENWAMDTINGPGFASTNIDWGAHPSRTTKGITINCYRIISNIRDKDVGSHVYYFNVPVAIDIYLRDIKAEGQKDEPSPKLILIENYLRELLLTNRTTLRSKGINNIMLEGPVYPQEPAPAGSELQKVWYHLVMQVRMIYHMFRVPT
jgi:hypothetical protein